ncbi:lantibiotic dehydratase [[Empedobacter] haloabium]|uniref:Lantibiotic dehydratase n=1 Tax=[Empedobacter] haloabium TaxID=592317 RepID=A0ABZ1UGV1_9BURK
MTTEVRFSHGDFFILRAPFLAPATWAAYRAAGPGWAARAAAAQQLFRQPRISEAIYLASANLHARMSEGRWDADSENGRKVLLAFERYLNRMCFRATPFGMFATVSHGRVEAAAGPTPVAGFAGDGSGRRHVRIDAAFLHALCDRAIAARASALRYLGNRSVYAAHGKLKYTDWVATQANGRNYQLAEIDAHPAILQVLALSATTASTPPELAQRLLQACPELAPEQARALVDDLVAARVLLPTLGVDLLADDPARALATALGEIPGEAHVSATLLAVLAELDLLNRAEHVELDDYRRLDATLQALLPATAAKTCLRVDSFRDADFRLDRGYCDHVTDELGLLVSRFSERETSLDIMAQQFERRYGKSRVPLSELLEDDMLFGSDDHSHNHEMLRKFGIDSPVGAGERSPAGPMRPFDRFLVGKLLRMDGTAGEQVIRITAEEVRALRPRGKVFPSQLFAIMTVLPPTGDGAAPRTWLQGISNSGVSSWSGRFAYAQPAMADALQAMARATQDENPDWIHAEICYRPAGHMANIMTRPALWPYRINLVEADARPSDSEIGLSDIDVAVVGGEMQLWSRSLDRRIMPHMTCAHNVEHSSSTKAYAFLRNIGMYPRYFAHFGWSNFFVEYPFLPRIEYDDIVLAPARWLIEPRQYKVAKGATAEQSRAAFSAHLDSQGVPALVELKEFDNTLLLDRTDPIDLEQLYRILMRRRRLVLREVVGHQSGRHPVRHEVLLPFAHTSKVAPQVAAPPLPVRDLPLAPMGEVVFVKIYLAVADTDDFLVEHCAPLLRALRRDGALQDWFFIRYADPEHHLRLRIFVATPAALAHVMAQFVLALDAQQRAGRIAQYAFAPYQREMARYGGAALLPLSERLFGIDSELALALLTHSAAGEQARWQAAVWSCAALIADFGCAPDVRHRIARHMAESYRAEFGLGSYQRDLLGRHFRMQRAALFDLLDDKPPAPRWAAAFAAAAPLRARRRALFAQARTARPGELDTPQFERVLQSHLHMCCIRLFGHHPRGYEVLVYDALERLYRSALGRERGALAAAA